MQKKMDFFKENNKRSLNPVMKVIEKEKSKKNYFNY
jgi:hypothetical protein